MTFDMFECKCKWMTVTIQMFDSSIENVWSHKQESTPGNLAGPWENGPISRSIFQTFHSQSFTKSSHEYWSLTMYIIIQIIEYTSIQCMYIPYTSYIPETEMSLVLFEVFVPKNTVTVFGSEKNIGTKTVSPAGASWTNKRSQAWLFRGYISGQIILVATENTSFHPKWW